MNDETGKKFQMFDKVKHLKAGQILEFKADVFAGKEEKLHVRFCVLKKSKSAGEKSIVKAKREMSKKQRTLTPQTLALHKYVIVMTSLPEEIDAKEVLDLYRLRWQVEIAFKKLKSIIGLGHLPKKDIDSGRAWIQGKIFLAMLTQMFSDDNILFSPWGYPTEQCYKVSLA